MRLLRWRGAKPDDNTLVRDQSVTRAAWSFACWTAALLGDELVSRRSRRPFDGSFSNKSSWRANPEPSWR
jgi:hypothetical protein